MTEKGKQIETVLDQFGMKHLRSYGHSFSDSGTHAACAVQRSSNSESKSAAALPGCCEFATGIIWAGSENRICSATSGTFCPASDFKNPKMVESCIFRKRKLEPEQT